MVYGYTHAIYVAIILGGKRARPNTTVSAPSSPRSLSLCALLRPVLNP